MGAVVNWERMGELALRSMSTKLARAKSESAAYYMGESPDDLSVYCDNSIEARWLAMWGLIGEWHGRSR